VYSTCLGGSGNDYGTRIAVDSSGNAYVTGETASTNFPTINPSQPTYGGGVFDVFVTELSPAGSALVYSTYLGGDGSDSGQGIAVDSSGNVYVTGQTFPNNFPNMNPLQPTYGGGDYDAFVANTRATTPTAHHYSRTPHPTRRVLQTELQARKITVPVLGWVENWVFRSDSRGVGGHGSSSKCEVASIAW
jgi:hypothetical protein